MTNINNDPILGVLSGIDVIEVGDSPSFNPNTPRSKTVFTVDELYVMLRELKRLLDPATIARLERLVVRHMADDNAHNITFESLSTSCINEFYREWLAYKNRTSHKNEYDEAMLKNLYSVEEFFKTIFQDIRIADTPTIDTGVDNTKVVSASGIRTYINKHNTALEAHDALFEYLFPGAVTQYTPTFSLIASTGVDVYMHVQAPDGVLYMDASGIMRVTPPNLCLPVDWSMGKPAYPIFGSTTNFCIYGNDFSKSNFDKQNLTVNNSGSNSIVENEKAWVVVCEPTDTAVDHTISYTIPAESLPDGTVLLCVSMFVKSDTISNIAINVYDEIENTDTAYRYNLTNRTTYYNNTDVTFTSTHSANCFIAANYTRCVYTCVIDNTKPQTVVIRPLDILDGDMTFKGSIQDKFIICGLQIEANKDVPSPYIHTSGSIASRSATTAYTTVTRNGRKWINPYQASYMVELSNNTPIKSPLGDIGARYVLDTRISSTNTSAYSLYYPAVHDGKLTSYFSKSDGAFGTSQILERDTGGFTKCSIQYANSGNIQNNDTDFPHGTNNPVFTIGNKQKIFNITNLPASNDISTDIDRLYIGCSVNGDKHLNGYLSELIYYPAYATADHIDFYTKG